MTTLLRQPFFAALLLLVAFGAYADRQASHSVSQKDKTFAPGELTVKTGDEVVFVNDDDISHNVFSRSLGSKFNLKIQKPGEDKSVVFREKGDVVVRCAIHPNMKMTIKVEE